MIERCQPSLLLNGCVLIGSGAAASLADALARGYQPAMIGMVLSIWAALISAIFGSDPRAGATVPAPATPVSEPAAS